MPGYDLFQPRRNMNEKCFWWGRTEDEDIPEEELVYKRVPDGFFYAKEIQAEAQNNNILAGVMIVDRTNVTLESNDDLRSFYDKKQILSEMYVKYQDEFWIVTDVQKKKAKIQNSEFGRPESVSHYWYISLRK